MNSSENKKVSSGLKKIVFKSNLPGQYVNQILDKYGVMQILNISPRTLKTYVRDGILTCAVIRGKSFYLYTDLLEMIERFKK